MLYDDVSFELSQPQTVPVQNMQVSCKNVPDFSNSNMDTIFFPFGSPLLPSPLAFKVRDLDEGNTSPKS